MAYRYNPSLPGGFVEGDAGAIIHDPAEYDRLKPVETIAPGLPGGPDPAMVGVGNQDPNRPGAPVISGGLVTGVRPAFEPKSPSSVTAKDFVDAYEDPAKLPDYFAAQLGDIKKTQNEVVSARASLNTNVQDLLSSRTEEGIDGIMKELRSASSDLADLNSTVTSMEDDVRRDLGPDVSESYIQAEVERRMTDLRPKITRAQNRQALAQNDYSITQNLASERFNALRADASETVNRVAQKLGFKVDNIGLSMGIMTSLKQFEQIQNAQKDADRDDARAMISLLMSRPTTLKKASDADLTALEKQAQFLPGMLFDIRESIGAGDTPIFQLVDDKGTLALLMSNPETGALSTKSFPNFAYIAPKTSSTSLANLKDPSLMSATGRWWLAETYKSLYSAASNTSTQERQTLADEASNLLGARLSLGVGAEGKTGTWDPNPADWAAYYVVQDQAQDVKNKELTANQLRDQAADFQASAEAYLESLKDEK